MAVVMPDDLVRLEIPALNHFVFTTREEVRVPGRHGEASDC